MNMSQNVRKTATILTQLKINMEDTMVWQQDVRKPQTKELQILSRIFNHKSVNT